MYDIYTERAVVLGIMSKFEGISIIEVEDNDNNVQRCINFEQISGEINNGDRVLINTTAVDLGLGTGGYHYVIANLDNSFVSINTPGHIMKLRYTPLQIKTLCIEEEDSKYHQKIKNFTDLSGKVIVIIPLHSLLAPLSIVFKNLYPQGKLVYIMTEGGSLSLEISHLVRRLKEMNYLTETITVGHCFGGDFEAVNIFTGLAAAHTVCDADLIVVGMGPGIVGTNTPLGFSGVENAFTNHAIKVLNGKSIFVPRISFCDQRVRHQLISHHTLTILKDLIDNRIDVVFPEDERIKNYIKMTDLLEKHEIIFYNYHKIEEILKNDSELLNSMGRSFTDDPLFFITGGLPVLRYRELTEG